MKLVSDHPVVASLAFSFVLNMLFFAVASRQKTDKLTDFSYALSFFLLAPLLLFSSANLSPQKIALALAIMLWSSRLGIYLGLRIHYMGRDERFDDKRDNFWKFCQFWLLQALSVWLIMLPSSLYLSQTSAPSPPLWPFWLGLSIFIAGLTIETVADHQKFQFRKIYQHRCCAAGLWRYSRHPNYFGEILLWWGLFLAASPSLRAWQWLSIVGPICISVLLLFVSGIPILEKRDMAKPDYLQYKQRTSLLIPMPVKKNL